MELPVGCYFQNRCERVQEKCREQKIVLEKNSATTRVRCLFPG